MFSHPYATIDEAWSTPSSFKPFHTPPLVKKHDEFKDAGVRQSLLKHQPVQPSHVFIKKFLSKVYITEGVQGILKYMSPCMVRDLCMRASYRRSFDLSIDELLYALLGMFALLLAIDL